MFIEVMSNSGTESDCIGVINERLLSYISYIDGKLIQDSVSIYIHIYIYIYIYIYI